MNLPRLSIALCVTLAACGDDTVAAIDMSVVHDLSGACTGGPAMGAADKHCYDDGGASFIAVDNSQCNMSAPPGVDYGDTMYGTSGNDDDCKYAVSYTVDPICRNSGVFFTVTLKSALTNALVPMAMTRAEVFLSDTHPAPNSGATYVETSTGVYKVGPILFDAAGTWTVRFHFFENCADLPTSPHGHAAFFVVVP
jgi:hypothetical protein